MNIYYCVKGWIKSEDHIYVYGQHEWNIFRNLSGRQINILLFVFNYKHRLILLRTRFEFTQLVNYIETTVSHILNNVMKYLKTSYQFNPSTVNRLLLL